MERNDLKELIKTYYSTVSDILFESNPSVSYSLFVLRSGRYIWLFKSDEFYCSTSNIIEYYATVEMLSVQFIVIEVPFFINVNKYTFSHLFPCAESKTIDYPGESGITNFNKLPQDFCLTGIKTFYDDLNLFDKKTIEEVNASIFQHSQYVTNPYNVKNRASELFIESFQGLASEHPEEEYYLRHGWNVIKLAQEACTYAEHMGPFILGGKLKEKDLYNFLFKRAGKNFSPVLLKELSSQIYFDTINGKYKKQEF